MIRKMDITDILKKQFLEDYENRLRIIKMEQEWEQYVKLKTKKDEENTNTRKGLRNG